jgi:nitric oxide reductase subunit B
VSLVPLYLCVRSLFGDIAVSYTRTQKVAFSFLARAVLLLALYAAASLFGAVKFLSNDDPFALTLPYQQVGALANVLLNLALVSGLVGGGIYMAAMVRADSALRYETLLMWTSRLWSVVLILAFGAGMLGLLNGRHMLELPPVLDFTVLVVIVSTLANVALTRTWPPTITVWFAGMALCAVCLVVGHSVTQFSQDRIFTALAVYGNLNVAYPLAAVALGFWLMRRFSNVSQTWADRGVFNVSALVALAGALLTAAMLYAPGVQAWPGNVALFAVPFAYLVFAAHSYKAIADRNPTFTLAAHWVGLAVLLFLLGTAVVAVLNAIPSLRQWTTGTRLSDLQTTLQAWAVLAVILGIVNQVAAEMRGQNRRVTGYTPFWLVTFGVIGGGLALGIAGAAQTYMERVLSVGYLDSQALLVPLYAFWVLGLVSIALGVIVYGLALWLRRPLERRTER